MLLQVIWSPWAYAPLVINPNLEAAAIIISRITQPFEGASLRVLYLVERVCYQLVGEDAPQVPMDPPMFMLTLMSMTDIEYQLWRNGIPYTQRVSDELDYEEFNDTCLMPSFTPAVSVLPSHSFPFFLCITSHNDVHMGYSCQVGPVAGAPINSPHLPWSIYVYGPNSFARKCPMCRNTNDMGYLFLKGTQAMSSSFLSLFLLSCIPILVLTPFPFKFSPLFRSMRNWFGL